MEFHKFKISLIILLFLNTALFAQTSNAILFTENGEKFTIILNGVRQNNQPSTNVEIIGLNAEFYKLKVIFSNSAIGERNFNLYINSGSETTYSIRKNNKGEYVIRIVSEVPIAQASVSPSSQIVVNYNENPAAASQTGVIKSTSTSETATVESVVNNENLSIEKREHLKDSIGKINRRTSGIDTGTGCDEIICVVVVVCTTVVLILSVPIRSASYVPGYTGPIGCPQPMNDDEFKELKATIASKTFEDTRMTIAKQWLNDRCVIATQVKDLTMLFTFENNRLLFAKYAYEHTYDIGNYFKVNEAFTFDNTTQELNEYINSRK